MKRFGSVTGRHIMHIEDVKANALGYEYLAYQQVVVGVREETAWHMMTV